MEISQKIKIKSTDAQIFSKIKVGGKPLFDGAQRKVAVLYGLANKRSLYAYMYIFQIYHDIEQLVNNISSVIKKIKRLIKGKQGKIPDVTVKKFNSKTLSFSNPLHFGLIRLLELHDDLILWLNLAQDCGAFLGSTKYFAIKHEVRNKILNLLFSTNFLNTEQLQDVNFNHYLDNDKLYQEKKLKYGEVDPNVFYIAVTSSVTPKLTSEEINKISYKLKTSLANHFLK